MKEKLLEEVQGRRAFSDHGIYTGSSRRVSEPYRTIFTIQISVIRWCNVVALTRRQDVHLSRDSTSDWRH